MYFGRCLVTGSGGWLGPYVVAALEAGGNAVFAVGRDIAVIEDVFAGWDVLVHLAPVSVEPFLGLAEKVIVASSGASTLRDDSYREGYAALKRADEVLCRGVEGHVARIYSVLGPGIPLDAHYAASTFLSQALAGGPVVVKDGAIRSYLHPKDLASALLTILAHGDGEPYDVGGEEPITVADLGRRIAAHAGVACHLAEPLPSDVYLPDLTRLHGLGWKQTISTDEAIADTLASLT